ncbi:unnamed protein product [Durusdinium trenchii]|uniref:Uncharacterized protein n=1 Tax=Durusdinium trenchii TaxID=1381693 RepID=A0ABP0M5M7_9DINO
MSCSCHFATLPFFGRCVSTATLPKRRCGFRMDLPPVVSNLVEAYLARRSSWLSLVPAATSQAWERQNTLGAVEERVTALLGVFLGAPGREVLVEKPWLSHALGGVLLRDSPARHFPMPTAAASLQSLAQSSSD